MGGAVSADTRAVMIYGMMERDPTDALEMINECEDVEMLDLLLKMLTHEGSARTDKALNEIFVGPVTSRLERVRR